METKPIVSAKLENRRESVNQSVGREQSACFFSEWALISSEEEEEERRKIAILREPRPEF